ncbi:phage protein NinX family protein [Alcaligenes aquatilis]|uniref:phage protein NinX family protein n=1 Tax=Alcaligenes aquatilis TaxID=323284 RepID=UPI003F91A08B
MTKVSELTGAELDYWVAKAERMDRENGFGLAWVGVGNPDKPGKPRCYVTHRVWNGAKVWAPSRNWSKGGPIIDREKIGVKPNVSTYKWGARIDSDRHPFAPRYGYGDTPLIAAMRAYVSSKYGETVPADAQETSQ